MRALRQILLACLVMAPAVASAQSDKDAERAFEQSIVQQELFVRNFSAESTVSVRWAGNALQFKEPFARSLQPLTIDEVHFKGRQLEIDARRPTVEWDRQVGFKPGAPTTPVRILIDLKGTDSKTVLPILRDALFFPDRDTALAAVSRDDGGTAPSPGKLYPELTNSHGIGPKAQTCDCADKGTEACRRRTAIEGATAMKMIHIAEPQFSEEARRKRQGGNVNLSLIVDEAGQGTDFWIVKPLGLGLDEEAVQTVQQYVFQPATCHDQPVRVPIHISVNFQIF